jgi:hypothetical protein
VAPAAVLGLVLVVAVPGPVRGSAELYPWAFEATHHLVDDAAPDLQADGTWSIYLVGGRSTPPVFVGLRAGLEDQGVDTGVDAGAPGLGTDEPGAPAGQIVLMPSFLAGPGADWTAAATYEPGDRDDDAAAEVADQLAAFARDTRPELLPSLAGALPALLCPALAADPAGFGGDCPAAQEVLAAPNPVAELDPGLVALAYLVRFGEDTQVPVIEGPAPPADVLDEAARWWDDIPLTVWAHREPGA